MPEKKVGYDGSGYPTDLHNFIEKFDDERLTRILCNFVPGKIGPVLSGGYSHHIDYELDTADKKFHRFSIAPDSNGTKTSMNVAKGKTNWQCELQVSVELYKNGLPANFGSLARQGLLESNTGVIECAAWAILIDGTLCRAVDIPTEMARIEAEKNKPTIAPNGKPYWDFKAWGPPSLPEHYAKYECTKPGDKKKKR